jgi:hypothetical protein
VLYDCHYHIKPTNSVESNISCFAQPAIVLAYLQCQHGPLRKQAGGGCTLWHLQKVAEAESIPLPKALVLTIALQICASLQALRDMQFFPESLHNNNILLDLKPETIKELPLLW